MSDLWERLRAAKVATDQAASAPPSQGPSPTIRDEAPPGWAWAAPLVAERRFSFPVEPGFWKAVAPWVDPRDWDGVLCFDTETTGLSGGAGTVPFLVGWASLVPPRRPQDLPEVEVRQWFLRDHPGEPDLVEALDAVFRPARGLVSFNGASFDLPLLRTRWTLAGREFPVLPHRDDLHPARRLWKRLLESCRLARVEETVLGLRRLDDVPGALVPALWFDYLRRGAAPDFVTPLEGVLRHHAQDVYSLLCLDLLMSILAKDPNQPRWEATFGPFPDRPVLARPAPGGLLHPDLKARTPVDFWGLLAHLPPPEADRNLEEAWKARGEEAVGLAWADRLKRRRDRRAVEVWTSLWESRGSYPALEELLKWLEHRDRDAEARAEALARIEAALKAPFLPRAWREGLVKRRDRLVLRSGVVPGPP